MTAFVGHTQWLGLCHIELESCASLARTHESQTKNHQSHSLTMISSSEFECKRLTQTTDYMETITKDGKAWAYIVEIREDGDPYYFSSRIDGLSFEDPTLVGIKSKLFADQPAPISS